MECVTHIYTVCDLSRCVRHASSAREVVNTQVERKRMGERENERERERTMQRERSPPKNAQIALETPRTSLITYISFKLPCFYWIKPLNNQQKRSSWRFKWDFSILRRDYDTILVKVMTIQPVPEKKWLKMAIGMPNETKSSMVVTGFFSKVPFEKRPELWPSRISFCILMTISSLIFSGTGYIKCPSCPLNTPPPRHPPKHCNALQHTATLGIVPRLNKVDHDIKCHSFSLNTPHPRHPPKREPQTPLVYSKS